MNNPSKSEVDAQANRRGSIIGRFAIDQMQTVSADDESVSSRAALSTALACVLRGKFCDAILPNRTASRFQKNDVIYDVGGQDRTLFFLQSGYVKVGSLAHDGREIIYDVRTSGDLIGELCVCGGARPDRAVALEETNAIPVPYEDIMEVVRKQPETVSRLVEFLCQALAEAYQQINALALDDILHRVAKVLIGLAGKIGSPRGQYVEILTYLTQEELSQMVAARRERVSTALNWLRRRGAIQYSSRGHLLLNMEALKSHTN
jgi:CRP/FNR family transcriptional regulator, cyclic AMP receptor protein